jgi:glycosyltransferase involved in cell wall biosynthesis
VKVRLLCFSQQFKTATSGLGTYARSLVEGLVGNGHEVTIATARSQCDDLPGIRFVPMDFTPGNVTPFVFPRMARNYRRVLAAEAHGHDVIHFLDGREAALGSFPTRPRVLQPIVGTIHDSYAVDWCAPAYPRHLYDDRLARTLYYGWLRWLERVAYRWPAGFAANSTHVVTAVARVYGIPEARIDVVPIGLPVPVDGDSERLDGRPAVLFVGRNYQRKGLPILLQAFARLRKSHHEARLHVVGGDPIEGSFRKRTRDLGIAQAVEFYGWQPNERVRAMMAGASLFAMPSLVEAFGLVYLEAMAAGTPVVATATGGVTQFFVDGEDMVMVAPGDVEALAEALERVTDDATLRDRLIARARATVARYSVNATVRGTEALYARLI